MNYKITAALVIAFLIAGLGFWLGRRSSESSRDSAPQQPALADQSPAMLRGFGSHTSPGISAPTPSINASAPPNEASAAKYLALKQVSFLPCSGGILNDKTAEILDLSADERERVQSVLDKTVADMKSLEEKNVRVLSDDTGEYIEIRRFWDDGGREVWERMTEGIRNSIGNERADPLNNSLSLQGYGLGGFGYYTRRIWVSEDIIADDGRKGDRVHIRNEEIPGEQGSAAPPPVGPDSQITVFPHNENFRLRYGGLFPAAGKDAP